MTNLPPNVERKFGRSALKLHLGCGSKYIHGWVHVDMTPHAHVDIVADARHIPLPDGCAQTVYACHLLEHFPHVETQSVLLEWRRLLTPGGMLRLAVPDIRAWCDLYLATHDLDVALGSIYGRQDYDGNTHYTGFDESRLDRALHAAGFKDIRHWDWKNTEHSHVDDYSQSYVPHMDKAHGRLMSLNMEATR